MITRWKIILLAVTVSNVINYFAIREILWSIVWLNRGGKLRSFIEYKKSVRVNESVINRISMRYLLKYVSTCQSDFIAWLKVKRIFVCIESIMEISYFLLGLSLNHAILFYYCSLFLLVQAILSFVFLRFQLGVRGHLTKYDRMRMKR